jgi:hypothetical protein
MEEQKSLSILDLRWRIRHCMLGKLQAHLPTSVARLSLLSQLEVRLYFRQHKMHTYNLPQSSQWLVMPRFQNKRKFEK